MSSKAVLTAEGICMKKHLPAEITQAELQAYLGLVEPGNQLTPCAGVESSTACAKPTRRYEVRRIAVIE